MNNEEFFRLLDTDNDGFITIDEMSEKIVKVINLS